MLFEVKSGQSSLPIYDPRYSLEVCMIFSRWWDGGGPCVVGLPEVCLGEGQEVL